MTTRHITGASGTSMISPGRPDARNGQRRRRPQRALLLHAIAAALASFGAQAEEASSLGTVVVSASRIEQDTLEAPANVSVVNRDKIEATGAVRVGDALTAKVPSLYMRGSLGTSTRINGGPILSLRGPGGVRVMLDGISLSDGNAGSLSSLMNINVSDIDRIEVVPGASSALYGSEAVGGVINVPEWSCARPCR